MGCFVLHLGRGNVRGVWEELERVPTPCPGPWGSIGRFAKCSMNTETLCDMSALTFEPQLVCSYVAVCYLNPFPYHSRWCYKGTVKFCLKDASSFLFCSKAAWFIEVNKWFEIFILLNVCFLLLCIPNVKFGCSYFSSGYVMTHNKM